MDYSTFTTLHNMFPKLLYVIDRNATAGWVLNNVMSCHNLMLVYEGQAEFICNGNKCTASKGELIYHKPGDKRYARTFPNTLLRCYAIDFVYTCPVFENGEWKLIDMELPFSFSQRITDEYLFIKVTELFSQLTKSALSAREQATVRERAIFIEILTLLFQSTQREQYNYSSVRIVDKVISYMIENHARSLTLPELSEYAGVSISYLGYVFRNVTGKSPIDYLIEIRINMAKNLLKDGVSVTETSSLVGFNDIYYFSRVFKAREGISPSKYTDEKISSP
ncbi:MAG: helix-turn-helix transcriptional regulator [Clostridiaceae bacterium]|nr:helix-turn-helix transcriptional regulator [Clostridiaceae bacterium]